VGHVRHKTQIQHLQVAVPTVDVATEVRREEALLKTGALQNAIFNSANFSSIATDERV